MLRGAHIMYVRGRVISCMLGGHIMYVKGLYHISYGGYIMYVRGSYHVC